MFSSFLKNFLIALGFLLIGFGIGMIMAKNFQIEENQYWIVTTASLILGGFFTALGIVKRTAKKEKAANKPEQPISSEITSVSSEERDR